ncbi:branched-chain amino acid ABC transporter permease [Enterocloster lavalensis]|uniref:Amino acid/amide ABC transporter membrane protein 1, HAAT family n=2 Tax=Lachnospiraceae TaxID=186803 RepID=A0A1I0CNG9_9FIRM|nr:MULTISPECIES: branched-chain amino acid ABC transporter permease [Enterocloster]MDR3757069.1 branched-chain amino acid ABC transporter permease [Enterocloster sp.]PST31556.1 branched-chain amino acid ABC transporter permease [Enterocloster lavalensis]SET21026.1 amino acid/amide ABC transporter membrane protein 1, HAAT family [Enterocloster lavalensis]
MMILLQLLVSGIAMGFVYALTAVEYTLIWNSSGLLNFGHEKVIMLGAYIFAGTMVLNLGTGVVPGFVATVAVMAVFGVLIAFSIFIPLRQMSRLCAIMATVMMGNIINEAVRLYYGPEAMTVKGFMSGIARVGNLAVAKAYIYIIVISIVIVGLLELFMRKTKTGKAMRCVASNKTAAALMGIDVSRNMAVTVAISFAICGALGISVIPVFSVNSSMATMISLKGFAAGVVGGFGSLPGAIVGGLAIGIAENIAGMIFPSTFKDAVAFIVLIAVLLVKPSGLLGKKR